jgi:hypothetical protein
MHLSQKSNDLGIVTAVERSQKRTQLKLRTLDYRRRERSCYKNESQIFETRKARYRYIKSRSSYINTFHAAAYTDLLPCRL